MKQTKRDIAVKTRFATGLLIVLLALLGVLTSGEGDFDPWIEISIKVLFVIYCVEFGYIAGWDANKNPSTLKGP